MVRRFLVLLALLALVACGHADAPELAFTGQCKLSVPVDSPGYVDRLLTPNEIKTHVDLRVARGMLVGMHVALPDGRATTMAEQEPDDPLLTGDTRPNVPLDPETDVEVPIEVSRKEVESSWNLMINLRFHGRTADGVVGRMRVSGVCVPDKPPE